MSIGWSVRAGAGDGAGSWAAPCVAAAGLLVWFVALQWLRPELIADEQYHYKASVGLAAGEWPHPQALSVLPAYHVVVGAGLRLCGATLGVARGISLLLSVALVFVLWGALRSRAQGASGPQARAWELLAIVWSPLALPYSALAYTEPASHLLLAAALYYGLRGRRWSSATALTLAYLVRQSNALWLPLIAILSLRPVTSGAGAHGERWPFLRESAIVLLPYVAAGVTMVAILWRCQAITFGATGSNEIRFNVAQLYCFATCCAILWAPLWIEQLGRDWRTRWQPGLAWAGICAAGLALVGCAELTFRNPHPWNSDPNYLRNVLLIGLHQSIWLRLALGGLLSVAGVALWQFFQEQPDRGGLTAIWAFSLAYLAAHWLVEPRYYLPVFLLLQFGMTLKTPQARRLAIWQTLLTLGLTQYMLRHAHAAGGVL